MAARFTTSARESVRLPLVLLDCPLGQADRRSRRIDLLGPTMQMEPPDTTMSAVGGLQVRVKGERCCTNRRHSTFLVMCS